MEEKMTQIFVGPKYEKFEKKTFSIPAFFFGGIYFAYRKMMIHALLVSLFCSILDSFASKFLGFGLFLVYLLCTRIAIGLYFPIWYRKFYRDSTRKVLSETAGKSEEETLRGIQKKGGTSIAFIILFIILNAILSGFINNIINDDTSEQYAVLGNNSIDEITEEMINSADKKVLEDVKITAYSNFGKISTVSIDNENYNCASDVFDLLRASGDYDEISTTVYYIEIEEQKTIVDVKLFNTTTNTELTGLTDEDSLRAALGYHSIGSHTEILTLVELDTTPGAGSIGDDSYTYYKHLFETEEGKTIEFRYYIYEDTVDKSDILVEGEKYEVDFDVEEGPFEYEYKITDIEKI